MYINFQQLYKSDISESDFMLLLKVSQKNTELLVEEDKPKLESFLELGLVELVKQGKDFFEKLRISKKGKQFIRNIESPKYSDEIQELEQKLVEMYEDAQKETGLRAEVKSRLTWFMCETGFRANVIKKYVQIYLDETDPKYIKNLSNLIWTAQSKAFSIHFDLKDSKLFDIISQALGLNQSVFLEKKDKELNYLFQYATACPPKGLRSELYYTGSYQSEIEHFAKLHEELTKRILR